MEQKGLDIKHRILLAAKELFAQKGVEGTSVREICEKANVNVSALSYYFGGKEKMFLTLFEEYFPGSKLSEYEEDLKEPVYGIQVLIREVIKFRLRDPEMAAILQHEITMQTPRIEDIRQYIFPVWLKLRELLALGKEQGLFHFRSLDQAMLYTMATVIFPRSNPFVNPILTEQTPTTEEVIQDTLDFIFNGLSGKH